MQIRGFFLQVLFNELLTLIHHLEPAILSVEVVDLFLDLLHLPLILLVSLLVAFCLGTLLMESFLEVVYTQRDFIHLFLIIVILLLFDKSITFDFL